MTGPQLDPSVWPEWGGSMAQGCGPLDQQRGPGRAEQTGLQEQLEAPTYQGWITKWPTDGKKLGTRKRR